MKQGQVIGNRYEIIRHLGSGGMATVYLAYDPILEREVAIKFLRIGTSDMDDATRRFKREAMSISEVNHPNIVNIYDVGDDDDGHYIVMEYIEGIDLKQFIRKNHPISKETYQGIMMQILAGVECAHRKGIIHRDLKPQNIMIKPDGQVKIMDFGIALVSTETSITQTNTIIGSVHYLSPEQARGSMASYQSDIYSLGIVSFEMLTGQVPFDGESAVSIAIQHFQESLPDINQFRSDIPQAMQNVIMKATAKEANERYQTCEQMRQDLATCLDPSRANEAPFTPSLMKNETIVMAKDAIEKQITDERKVSTEAQPEPKETAQATKAMPLGAGLASQKAEAKTEPKIKAAPPKTSSRPKRRWPWFIGGLLAILLLLGVFVFGQGQSQPVPDLTNMTEDQARNSLVNNGFSLGESHQEYSDQVESGRVIRTDPSSGRKVKADQPIDLYISQGKEPIEIPNYQGQTLEQAKKDAEKKGFSVSSEEVYSEEVEKGKVISQNPAPGASVVASETNLHLVVSLGKEPLTMANLQGLNQAGVQQYAQSVGLNVSFNEANSDSVPKGLVVSQSIAPGANFNRGANLTVTLSLGPEEEPTHSFRHTITIPYKGKRSRGDSDGESNSQRQAANEIEIYIDDLNHSYNEVADRFTITDDKSYTLSFETEPNKTARFKVVRDGKTILENRVKPGDD
ncbi:MULTISPECIES: Stk1 family PASTA domain-containing Ser/Thr kinase [Aerococcus]|uniref:non-specific serine/threonine protein kinase n=2 Tax=Aerococcus TaxID=1375 RepID=A0A178HD75_9LACT|nr:MULTISPECIES: Stk1 family PASTA domain-containing Ser/Thr kinase [Aerococcus]KAA9219963.1 Stk1 family PASTA domain-containing Ser/Thr kinase [Aerococcus loyolae]KAA9265915.1 Stk1 family PASTA domain-containing Ser/Thr kinase [Aerococcus loyolae]MCY3026359.1 Stk1 family PASTA domain-containing Ser/Thr kinase [Aerococcus loyolae]MCY3028831.1 Stk1 family PASTA domain-containing Ser/Thr kinase [Aerococcus loyolae]MDK6231706.1 Stk1 family PASTA domain-containing Ser/Thr kinase [Aerococcus urinae